MCVCRYTHTLSMPKSAYLNNESSSYKCISNLKTSLVMCVDKLKNETLH